MKVGTLDYSKDILPLGACDLNSLASNQFTWWNHLLEVDLDLITLLEEDWFDFGGFDQNSNVGAVVNKQTVLHVHLVLFNLDQVLIHKVFLTIWMNFTMNNWLSFWKRAGVLLDWGACCWVFLGWVTGTGAYLCSWTAFLSTFLSPFYIREEFYSWWYLHPRLIRRKGQLYQQVQFWLAAREH